MASYFFPHDFSARNDPKMQELLIDMGLEGIGLYWCIVEQLYEQDNRLPLKSCKNIAYTYHVSEKAVKQLITAYDLFCNDGTDFWSQSVESRMTKLKEISEKRRKSAYNMHAKHHANANETDANARKNDANAEQMHAKTMQMHEKIMQNGCKCTENACKSYANKKIKEINKEKEIYKERETPTPAFVSDLVRKAEDLRNDVYRLHGDWVETFCMNNHISVTDFRIWMDEFTRTLQDRDERTTMADFKSHFASWFKIQFNHAKEKKAKTQRYDDAKDEMQRAGEAIRLRFDRAKQTACTPEELADLRARAKAGDKEAIRILNTPPTP